MSKRRPLLRRLLLVLVVLLLVAVAGVWLLVRASLPRLNGDLSTPGLAATVTITRDALGVATIKQVWSEGCGLHAAARSAR